MLNRRAVNDAVCDDILNRHLRLGIREIIDRNAQQRNQRGGNALVLHLHADLGDDPAERARKTHHQQRKRQHKRNRARNARPCRAVDRIDRDRGQHHDGDEHQIHQIYAGQARYQNRIHRYRHRQQQIVILRHIQRRIDGKHAAEQTQRRRNAGYDQEIQPVHLSCHQRRAHQIRHCGEYAAQHHHDQQHIAGDEQNRGGLASRLAVFAVLEKAPVQLQHLFLNQRFQHFSASSSRNTLSSDASPRTSSMLPERISLPLRMIVTVSHSFSATSSTWVE